MAAFQAFISHSGKDKELVEGLCSLLECVSINFYVAEREEKLGKPLEPTIRKRMAESNCVLLLWTSDGSMSQWVTYELGLAKGADKPVFPLVESGARLGPIEGLSRAEFKKGEFSLTPVNQILSALLQARKTGNEVTEGRS